MTTISNNDIARAIYLVSKDSNQEEQFFSKVIQFLAKKRLLTKASDILRRLNKIINEENKVVVVKVSSKEKIDEKTNKELAEILIKRYSAKKIILVENIDEKLLGGFKIEINDEVIDLTLKNKIGKLQEYLTSNHE